MGRKLAAILATDVVGYSSLMSEDEAGTVARLKAHRADLFDPKVSGFGGRVVKLMGDGTLVEFASVQDAVQCAIEIQRALAGEEGAFRLRMGINLGDIILEDDDVYGDGVNVAARLEALSPPGGICISDMVYQNVQAKLDATFEDMGEQQLKNIARPVRTWQWRAESTFDPVPMPPASREPLNNPAIAVLPFNNLSGNPDQDYFSDGLTEDLITAISYWRTFPVIARNSSFSFKGETAKTGDIAKALGARYILGGSVRAAGNRVRITATLVDAELDHELWAERFDRELTDIFDVQDEITRRVAAVVGHEVEQAELARISKARTSDFTAWDLVVQGIPHFLEHNCAANRKAQDLFKQATERATGYCDAWAYLAWTYAHDLMLECAVDAESTARLGLEAGKRAIALNDDSALAHLALSSVLVWTGEAENGLAEAQRAHELNPNDVRAAFAVGNRLTLTGELSKGVETIEDALKLNPRDPYRWHYYGYLARAYLSLGEAEKAIDWAQKAVRLRSDQPEPHFRLALCHAHLGAIDEARSELAHSERLEPGFIDRRKTWKPYPDEKRNSQLLDPLRQASLL